MVCFLQEVNVMFLNELRELSVNLKIRGEKIQGGKYNLLFIIHSTRIAPIRTFFSFWSNKTNKTDALA